MCHRFSEKTLRCNLKYRVFIIEALGINTCGREQTEAGVGRGRSCAVVPAQPHGTSGVHVPFRDVLSRAGMAGRLYSCLSKAVHVGHLGKRCNLREVALGSGGCP